MYKISIISPTYNCEKYIERTIKSIIKQTIGFENLELILVDDNSSDSTKDIINEYTKKYENIKLFEFDENHGFPGAGRNYGMYNAQSDYVMFIDNDDEYEADFCEIMYNTIISEKVDVVSANYTVIKPNETVNIDTFDRINKYSNRKPDKKIIELNEIFLDGAEVWCKIFKHSIIVDNDIKFIENGLNEDVIFLYEYYYYSKKLLYLDYYGYKWHRDYENLSYYSFNSTMNYLNSNYVLYDLITKLYPNVDLNEFFKSPIAGIIIRIIFSYENKPELKLMLKALKKFEDAIEFNNTLNRKRTDVINKLLLKNRITSASILIILINKTYALINNNHILKSIFNRIFGA